MGSYGRGDTANGRQMMRAFSPGLGGRITGSLRGLRKALRLRFCAARHRLHRAPEVGQDVRLGSRTDGTLPNRVRRAAQNRKRSGLCEARGLKQQAMPDWLAGCSRPQSAHFAGKRSVCGSVRLATGCIVLRRSVRMSDLEVGLHPATRCNEHITPERVSTR